MLTGGELWDHAAIFGVDFDLRGNNQRLNGAVVNDRRAGFIA